MPHNGELVRYLLSCYHLGRSVLEDIEFNQTIDQIDDVRLVMLNNIHVWSIAGSLFSAFFFPQKYVSLCRVVNLDNILRTFRVSMKDTAVSDTPCPSNVISKPQSRSYSHRMAKHVKTSYTVTHRGETLMYGKF